MTGIPDLTRAVVRARALDRCERCGEAGSESQRLQIHHRKPRGMGGTSDPTIHCPSNLILVCWSCHAWVESNRTTSLELGWLVRQRDAPNEIPVPIWGLGFRYLEPDGGYAEGSP